MIISRLIIEVVGSPKDYVEKVVGKVVEKAKEEEGIKVLKADFFEAKEVKGLWTSFTEIEARFKNAARLIGFCFDYMPSSVEILEPEEIELEVVAFSELINDLLGKLHEYDKAMKNLKAENILIKKEFRVD